MHSVFLSPSLQEHNPYATGGVESEHMFQVANVAAALLKLRGVRVLVSNKAWIPMPGLTGLYQAVASSNAAGVECHVAIHSNAGPKGADGTDTYYFAGSAAGKLLALDVQKFVAPVSPGSDGGIHANSTFYELRNTQAPACLVEVAFHSDSVESKDINERYAKYGEAVAKGIAAYLGVKWELPKPLPTIIDVVPFKKALLALATQLKLTIPAGFNPASNKLGDPARKLLAEVLKKL